MSDEKDQNTDATPDKGSDVANEAGVGKVVEPSANQPDEPQSKYIVEFKNVTKT